jgi:hypothetical protein
MVVTAFMDHGVELARTAVDIPVVGIGGMSLLVGSMMGRALGLVSPSSGKPNAGRAVEAAKRLFVAPMSAGRTFPGSIFPPE